MEFRAHPMSLRSGQQKTASVAPSACPGVRLQIDSGKRLGEWEELMLGTTECLGHLTCGWSAFPHSHTGTQSQLDN
jgi:hypothetical protein